MSGSGAVVRSRYDTDVQAISQARDTFVKAFNATDIDDFIAQTADDAVFMAHTGPPAIVGKEAVRANYKDFFERGPFIPSLTFSSDELVLFGGWAFDRGTWKIIRTYKRGGRRERLDSSYMMIWRREPGSIWKVARLIWNGTPVPLKSPKSCGSLEKLKESRRK